MVFSNGKHSLILKKSTSSENLSKKMKVRKIIGRYFSAGHTMDTQDLLTGDSSNRSIT